DARHPADVAVQQQVVAFVEQGQVDHRRAGADLAVVAVRLRAQFGAGEGEVAEVARDGGDRRVLQGRLGVREGREEGVDLVPRVLGVVDVAGQGQRVPDRGAGHRCPVVEEHGRAAYSAP